MEKQVDRADGLREKLERHDQTIVSGPEIGSPFWFPEVGDSGNQKPARLFARSDSNPSVAFDWHGLRFEGAFPQPGDLLPRPGIYVIWCHMANGLAVLDLGESDDVRARVLSHDRKDCWRRNCAAEVWYGAHYTAVDGETRRRLEAQLREAERPPCGKT
jgi:hypothetical protein